MCCFESVLIFIIICWLSNLNLKDNLQGKMVNVRYKVTVVIESPGHHTGLQGPFTQRV